MGIQGLLRFLEEATEVTSIQKLKGSSVAIDSYCWLHRGAFAVGDKLARNEETNVHIMYCVKFVNMLLSNNIKPILVFDGRHLPAKAETEAKRRKTRKENKERAVELMRKGKHSEARQFLQRCVDITHEMALTLIQVCRAMNVDCVVAPYEADAQLAYLNKIGLAEYVITEDSDLILFGCRKIIYKLDMTGKCQLIDSDKLHKAMKCKPDKFKMDKFRLMCILSGCDYVESLPGIGLVKAKKFVNVTEETDLMRALDKIPAYLNMRDLTVTKEYKINVLKARATFLHMVVFDPRRRKQVRLHELDEFGTEEEYISNAGEIMDDDEKALQLAIGNLNPFTMKKLDNWNPDRRERPKLPNKITIQGFKVAKHPSIWHRDYRFTTSLNGVTSSMASSTAPKKPMEKAIKLPKRVIDTIEDNDEDLPTESQNDDLMLKQYLNEPSPKRFKEDDNSDESNEPEVNGANGPPPNGKITPNRNPFKKKVSCIDPLLSPTRISRETNSLVKNQSPVKRIDYDKLKKLSKFNRTEDISSNKLTISRFFASSTKSKSESNAQTLVKSEVLVTEVKSELELKTETTEVDLTENAQPGAMMKSPNILDSALSSPKSMLYFNKCTDSGFSVNNEEPAQKSFDLMESDSVDNMSREHQYNILEKFKFALKEKIDDEPDPMECLSSQSTYTSDKTDNSEFNGLPIVLSDNENEIENSQKEASSSIKRLYGDLKPKPGTKVVPKAKLRRIKSTSKGKTSTSANSNDSQSRLSMFGFQKKPILKH